MRNFKFIHCELKKGENIAASEISSIMADNPEGNEQQRIDNAINELIERKNGKRNIMTHKKTSQTEITKRTKFFFKKILSLSLHFYQTQSDLF